jgi:TATA-box binding protein (TBP) (component of TFIID and TFIIIB)
VRHPIHVNTEIPPKKQARGRAAASRQIQETDSDIQAILGPSAGMSMSLRAPRVEDVRLRVVSLKAHGTIALGSPAQPSTTTKKREIDLKALGEATANSELVRAANCLHVRFKRGGFLQLFAKGRILVGGFTTDRQCVAAAGVAIQAIRRHQFPEAQFVRFAVHSAFVVGELGFHIDLNKAREAELLEQREERLARYRMGATGQFVPLSSAAGAPGAAAWHGEEKEGGTTGTTEQRAVVPVPVVGGYYDDVNLPHVLTFKIEEPQAKGTLMVYRTGRFQLNGTGFEDRRRVKAVVEHAFPALCRYRSSAGGGGSLLGF